jgi:putative transposase
VRKAFKFRAYPNTAQIAAMEAQLETHRRLYNNALDERKTAFECGGLEVSCAGQQKRLTERRSIDPFLSATNHTACQRTLKRLDRAYQAFFRRVKAGADPGFPRFRGRDRFDSIEFTAGDGARLTDSGRAYFQHVGAVKIKQHRPIEGTVKTLSFRRQADGWFVVFSCDLGDALPDPSGAPAVGIDLGLKMFLATSNGEEVAPPKFYRKAQTKLRKAARSVARKRKGGSNRRKARLRLARHHQHVSDQRRDFHHRTAFDLVSHYGMVAHEALNIKGIARSPLAKSTHDAGWSQFLAILTHKAECAGVRVVAVDPRLTTQTCSGCGGLPAVPLTLAVRRYECAHCGLSLDRDLNAAKVVLKRAWTGPLGVNVEDVALMRSPRSLRLQP